MSKWIRIPTKMDKNKNLKMHDLGGIAKHYETLKPPTSCGKEWIHRDCVLMLGHLSSAFVASYESWLSNQPVPSYHLCSSPHDNVISMLVSPFLWTVLMEVISLQQMSFNYSAVDIKYSNWALHREMLAINPCLHACQRGVVATQDSF